MERLRRGIDAVISLRFALLRELPDFWVGFYQFLESEKPKMKDQYMAERLLDQGRQALFENDLNKLKVTVQQLLLLLPSEEREAVQQGFGSGLVK